MKKFKEFTAKHRKVYLKLGFLACLFQFLFLTLIGKEVYTEYSLLGYQISLAFSHALLMIYFIALYWNRQLKNQNSNGL